MTKSAKVLRYVREGKRIRFFEKTKHVFTTKIMEETAVVRVLGNVIAS